MIPDSVYRPALEDSGEEARDSPADENGGYGIQRVLEVRIVGGEDAAVEEEDTEFRRCRAGWVDGLENVEGSAGFDGVGEANSNNVFAEAVVSAWITVS